MSTAAIVLGVVVVIVILLVLMSPSGKGKFGGASASSTPTGSKDDCSCDVGYHGTYTATGFKMCTACAPGNITCSCPKHQWWNGSRCKSC